MRNLVLFILFTTCSLLEAQTTYLGGVTDLLKKANGFTYNNIDSALSYAHQALKIAKSNGSKPSQIFDCQRVIGLIFEENNRLNDATQAYKIALDIAEKYLSDTEKFKIYTDWAIVHKKLGQYKIANEYHWKTIDNATKVGNWEMVENGYHGLGTMYSMMSAFDKSIEMYYKSIEVAEKRQNTEGVILSNQNISNIYFKAKNYQMALKHIQMTYEMAKRLDDSARLASVLKIYGKIEMALGHYDQALEKNLLAKSIFEKKGDKPKLAEAYLAIAEVYAAQNNEKAVLESFEMCKKLETYFSPYLFVEFYSKLGNYFKKQYKINEAIAAFKISLLKTDLLGFNEIARDNHLFLADIFEKKKDFRKAYEHIIIADRLSEVLFEEAKQKSMTEAQFKFDIQQRDSQIEAQQKLLTQSRIIRGILIGLLAVVLGFLFFTWRQMREKQRVTQKTELLMKELHHRVKNNLQTVTSLMRLQARHISDPSVSEVLSESRSRLEAISMIHQQLYVGEEVKSINFKLFLEDLIEKLCFTYGMSNKPFEKKIELEKDLIDVDLALTFGLIINELLTNSFKYAYPSVEKPKLEIQIKNHQVYYADNGKGLPANFELNNSKSFGFHLITSMIQQLKGKYSFGNKNGMYFKFSYA